jgi:hypothetical protein
MILMLLSDFFIIRDEFLKHVRNKLKGIDYANKFATLDAKQHDVFIDFRRSNILNDTGKNELIIVALNEVRKTQIFIRQRIAFHLDQIELIGRSSDKPKKKQEQIDENQKHINYLTFNYTPKFPSRDQNTFLRTSFDENLIFRGFRQSCEKDETIDITVIGDAVFAKLKPETDLSKVFKTKDRIIYEEM